MSDECDAAFELEDIARLAKVRSASVAAQVIPALSATCFECGEPTANGARWCDAECRDYWQLRRI